MKKIALVYPAITSADDFTTGKAFEEVLPPLWALALATYLREALPGARLEILDEQILGPALFRKKLQTSRYALAGLSPMARTYPRSLECARVLKKNGATVVFGGHYAPALFREILALRGPGSKDHCLDAIVRFDGEKAFYELARGTSFSRIKNLIYKGPGGEIVENPVEELDLAALPPVNYDLIRPEDYFRLQKPPAHSARSLPFISQRGCRWAQGPGRCIFCSIQSHGPTRALRPEDAALRMAGLKKKYGVGCLFEGSDDFVADGAWFKEFVRAGRSLDLPELQVFARCSILNRSNLAGLRAVNARFIKLGVESLSGRVMTALKKGVTVEMNLRAIRLALEAGLTPNINLVLGLPGETRETLSETFAAIKKLDLPVESCRWASILTLAVLPGTEVWTRLLEKEPKYRGRDLLDYDESYRDWLHHFCGVTQAEVLGAKAAMEKYFSTRMEWLLRNG